jgi:hypothetical protein
MSEITPRRVLAVAEGERLRKLKEYGDDLDDDAEPDSGPAIRYRVMEYMFFGITDEETVYAQVLADPDLGGLARLGKVVLESTQHHLGLSGTIRRATPERYELNWSERS